jgi:hypothetical protein
VKKTIILNDDESIEISVNLQPDPASRLRSIVALAHARADELMGDGDDRLRRALDNELDAMLTSAEGCAEQEQMPHCLRGG